MRDLLRWLLLTICMSMLTAVAGETGMPLPLEKVPEPLKPWVDWVVDTPMDQDCPRLLSTHSRICAWPGRLQISAGEAAAKFYQSWEVFNEQTWVPLPGDDSTWPQSVTIDDQPAVVILQQGRPAIRVPTGEHAISGEFIWQRMPDTLQLSPDTGLFSLRVGETWIEGATIDPQGRLRLRQNARDTAVRPIAKNSLHLEVFRLIDDGHPLQVTTRIFLKVAGTLRNIDLGKVLLDGTNPLHVQSTFPARLEQDGRLKVQVGPGSWSIEVVSRYPGNSKALTLPSQSPPWPASEVWAFRAHPDLRMVKVQGLVSIDPRQTRIPPEWRNYPAYRVEPGKSMRFELIRRGDPQPSPNRLTINRDLWLDFNGGGFTAHDLISGQMSRGWRLTAGEDMVLGQAKINGRPQFITHLPTDQTAGIEVRRGALDVEADSRLPGLGSPLSAVGWDHDFERASTTLHLAPGWRLLLADGVSSSGATWVQRWTLLDLFLVLLIAIAAGRLWSWPWAVIALAGLTLTWHEPEAPQFIWINLLIAAALLRVLPVGKWQIAANGYRSLAAIALIVIFIPFSINQVRTGIYPQLDASQHPGYTPLNRAPAPATALDTAKTLSGVEMLREKASIPRTLASRKAADSTALPQAGSVSLDQIDPKARIQTGPGIPQWRWSSIPLRWEGPVSRNQQLNLTIASPGQMMLWKLLGVLWLALLAIKMTGVPLKRLKKRSGKKQHARGAVALILVPVLMVLLPDDVAADYPPQSLLNELGQKLQPAPSECLPGCGQIPRMSVSVVDNLLTLRLEVQVAEPIALPLPIDPAQWIPEELIVDGELLNVGRRQTEAGVWIPLDEGIHDVVVRGVLARSQTTLPLPLKPHYMTSHLAPGWKIEGIRAFKPTGGQIRLLREARAKSEKNTLPALQPRSLPPFLQITRTLRLGVDWTVETAVHRVSKGWKPVDLWLPLIAGEQVLSEGKETREGAIRLTLAGNQRDTRWVSSLNKKAVLVLTAADTTTWLETWRVDIGSFWHVDFSGIPMTHRQTSDKRLLPTWRPWPGETVSMQIIRPEGVAGPTLTFDASELAYKPGLDVSDTTFKLQYRSSQGGQHTIRLPDGVSLKQVIIQGRSQPLKLNGRELILPLTPGRQEAVISWQQPQGVSFLTSTPVVDLGLPSINNRTVLNLGRDRWVLLAGGPQMGPAVLCWGVFIGVLFIGWGLGKSRLTPLHGWQWMLLLIGLSQVPILYGLIVVVWLLALGIRGKKAPEISGISFDLMQVGLVILTLAALGSLMFAVQAGLLGSPDMQIQGNQSSAYTLRWMQDRNGVELSRPWAISAPMWVYRVTMLLWALWLAFSLLKWLRWGWDCFSKGTLWKPREPQTGTSIVERIRGKIINRERNAVDP